VVSLGRIQAAVRAGKLDGSRVVTMRDLRDAGLASKRIDSGVKLLSDVRALNPVPCCPSLSGRRLPCMQT
jgi:hypothetical protein